MSSGSCLIYKLYDKILKMPSKSHDTIPLKGRCIESCYCATPILLYSYTVYSVAYGPKFRLQNTKGAEKFACGRGNVVPNF
jgi:hypothetical protein